MTEDAFESVSSCCFCSHIEAPIEVQANAPPRPGVATPPAGVTGERRVCYDVLLLVCLCMWLCGGGGYSD